MVDILILQEVRKRVEKKWRMRKYKNVMRNTIVLRNGIKIPAGHIIELDEDVAATAGAALRPIDNLPPSVGYYQQQEKAGLSTEDRDKLDKVSALLEQFPNLLETITQSIAKEVKDNINVTVNQVAGTPGQPMQAASSEPVPVILDALDDTVDSNIGESTETRTESASTFADKLKKIKENKGE
jgi:hypothetical protein